MLKEVTSDAQLPFFSVVVPCYNVKPCFDKVVASLEAQIFKNFEVLFVDDCSDADKLRELRNVVESSTLNYRLITCDLNVGPAGTRNQGILHSRGEYICFLDSDDVWFPEKLQVVYETARKLRPRLMGHLMENTGTRISVGRSEIYNFTTRQLLIRNRCTTSALVVRRADIQLFNSAMRYCEDYDFIIRHSQPHGMHFIMRYLGRLDRPVLSKGGLSSDIYLMRLGEMIAYSAFCLSTPKRFWLLPILLPFSIAKHVYKMIIMFFGRLRDSLFSKSIPQDEAYTVEASSSVRNDVSQMN